MKHPVLHLNATRSKQTGKVHLTFVAKEKEFRLDTLFCNIIIQIMPEERIPKVKAEFVAAVIDDWKKNTAQEKLETRRGLFPL